MAIEFSINGLNRWIMITEEQIIEILKSYSTYTDRSRTDECVHESNFDLIAKELVKKLTI